VKVLDPARNDKSCAMGKLVVRHAVLTAVVMTLLFFLGG
jgi:hypothetical protein